MPRKGPAPKRPVVADPVYGAPIVSQLVNKILLDGKKGLAERIVYDALDGVSAKNGADAVVTLKKALDNVRPTLEVKSPPRRWIHLPGAGRGQASPRQHPRAALAHQLRQGSSREDHDRASHQRDPRRIQRSRRRCEASRRHAQDGRRRTRRSRTTAGSSLLAGRVASVARCRDRQSRSRSSSLLDPHHSSQSFGGNLWHRTCSPT